jgi:4-amino-4-deoxy-L-arabinose transferase-like glycosyltransferase
MVLRRFEFSGLALILGLSLFLRLDALDVFLTTDERNWSDRSQRFRAALETGQWTETYQSSHPGVLTMWAGTTAMALEPGHDWASAKTLLVFGGRRIMALLSWLSLIPIWLLVRRLWGPWESMAGLFLVAFDPFLLAHGRLLHLDALTALLMTVSLLSLALHVAGRGGVLVILLSGAAAGAAALNKTPALVMVPFTAVTLTYTAWRRSLVWAERLRTLVRDGLLWGLALAMVYCLIWPAMWVAPVETLRMVIRGAVSYAKTPHENANFFWGQRRLDPGPAFYPVALLFRLTPLVLLGLLGCLWQTRRRYTAVCLLLAFCLTFSVFMTLGAKKFDRYVLPVFPSLDLLAGLGLVATGQRLLQRQVPPRHQYRLRWGGLALLALGQTMIVLLHRPYYLTYYNPLLGGGRQAVQRMLVGWGEGLDQAADWLNRQPQAERLTVATVPYHARLLGHFFRGRVVEFSQADLTTDYLVFYVNLLQRDPEGPSNTAGHADPVQTVLLKGIEYAQIYPASEHLSPLVDYLSRSARNDDLVVTSDFAPFLSSQLPVHSISLPVDLTVEEAAAQLTEAAVGRDRIWYVYGDAAVERQSSVSYQLSTRCLKLSDTAVTSSARVAAYQLLPTLSFGVTPIEHRTAVRFEDVLELTGSGGFSSSPTTGQAVDLALRWRTSRPLQNNYGLSLRLIDERGLEWGSHDRWLLNSAQEPTATWSPESVQFTYHSLPLVFGTPPGKYIIHLTVYHRENSQTVTQLDAHSERVPVQGPVVELGPVWVRPSNTFAKVPYWYVPWSKTVDLAGAVHLLGRSSLPKSIAPGATLPLALFWQAQKDHLPDYDLWLALESAAGGEIQTYRAPPSGAAYPSSLWRRGEYLRGQVGLLVPATFPAGEYRLLMNLASVTGDEFLAPEPVEMGTISVEGRLHLRERPDISRRQQMHLGTEILFLGYDLPQKEVSPGGTLPLTLYWEAAGSTEVSYKVFTHLLDAGFRLWGQQDSLPKQGHAPTTSWVAGEFIADEYWIPVDDDAPNGLYRIEIGMYNPTNGVRVSVTGPGGQPKSDNRILLDQPVRVTR